MTEIPTNHDQKKTDGFGTRTVHNVLWRFLSGGWRFALTIATTPFIVHGLGEEAYGILALALSFIGYFMILDFDIGVAVTKYVAEYKVKEDWAAIKKAVETSLFLFVIIGSAVALFFLVSADFLVAKVIKVSAGKKDVARVALYLVGINFMFNMPTWIYGAVLQAYHRFDLLSKLGLSLTTLTVLGTVILVALGFGLVPVLWLNIVVTLLTLVTYAFFAKKVCPEIRLRPGFDRSTAKQLFSFSAITFLGKLLGSVWFRIDRLLIAAMVSAAAVTYYQVAYVPILMGLRLGAVFQNVTLPMASEFHGRDQGERLRVLYLRGSKLAFIMALTFGIPLFVFSHPILKLWMGPTFAEQGTLTLRILAIWSVEMTLSTMAFSIVLGITRPWLQTTFQIGLTILSIPVFFLLIPRLGIVGAALGLAVPHVVLFPFYVMKINRILGVQNRIFLATVVIRPLISAVLVTSLSWLFLYSWVDSAFKLVFGLGACVALLYLVLLLTGALSTEDRQLLWSTIPHPIREVFGR